jgi:hypothetical protein
MGKQFALLVGIDHYLKGDRPARNGQSVEVRHLRGCVNDVQIISEVLRDHGIQNQTLLTAASSQPSASNSKKEPTYANIVSSIRTLLKEAEHGDLFFFHFSGHGANLTPIDGKSPKNRKVDASLIPMDFCCEQPALRGWELNSLLEEFYKKKVHVVVSLDSCYSADAWREYDSLRTPSEWEPPPSLPIDQAVDELRCSSDSRSVNGERVWGINPENFVMMTACGEDQGAKEVDKNGRIYGIFTYELCHYLVSKQRDNLPRPTYLSISHYVDSCTPASQTPQVFARDRLAFLETKAVFVSASIQVKIRDDEASLPIGKAHGVKKGAVFINRLPQPEVTLVVDDVSDFNSKGTLHGDLGETVPEFVPHKWSSEEMIRVLVHPDLGPDFRIELQTLLQQRIASALSVQEIGLRIREDDEAIHFMVRKAANNRVDISGPPTPRCPELRHYLDTSEINSSDASVVKAAANTIAHLFRFAQVCSLRSETQDRRPKFEVTPNFVTSPEAPLTSGCEVRCTFENKDHDTLYYTVLNLAPEYWIGQTILRDSRSLKVPAGETNHYESHVEIDQKVREIWKDSKPAYHDILRFIVTREQPLSLEYLELPDIWNSDQVTPYLDKGTIRKVPSGRYVPATPNVAWWTKDIDIYTK